MKKIIPVLAAFSLIFITFVLFTQEEAPAEESPVAEESEPIALNSPRYEGTVSVEEAIYRRVSTRRFSSQSLQKDQVGQLLWSAIGTTVQGVTGATRAYPSAGGINPLGAYVVIGDVEGISSGIYKYNCEDHTLHLIVEGDVRQQLMEASYNQRMVGQAPASIIITGNLQRVEDRYGEGRGPRYLAMDVGAAGQNIHLQAEALNLGTVIVGAFHDNQIRDIVTLDEREAPLYIMPIGHFPESD